MAGTCSGLRVIEISNGMPAALAGMVLADHGADVVKLASGRPQPFMGDEGSHLWDRGKRLEVADAGTPNGRARFEVLAKEADVVLLGIRPVTAEAWGLTPESLRQLNSRLVVGTVSGFGWAGPHREVRATDGMVHALCGSMNAAANGGHRLGPVFETSNMASYGAGNLLLQGVLAALRARDGGAPGQHVDASLFDGLMTYRGYQSMEPERNGEDFPPVPPMGSPKQDHRGIRPLFNLNQCRDGRWLSMGAFTQALSQRSLGVLGLSHLLEDPKFAGVPNTFPDDAAKLELLEILWARFREKDAAHWFEKLDAAGIPCEVVRTVDQFREHPQLWANGHAVEVDDPHFGKTVQQGSLATYSATPSRAGRFMGLGATGSGWQKSTGSEIRKGDRVQDWSNANGPLSGLRVLDLSVFLSGPTCTRLLADMGAEVTKVEPLEGDDFRKSAVTVFVFLHRQKRGVAIDLKRPEGQAALRELVKQSDVVVYNFRLGVEERLGLTYEELKAVNPNVVVCRITALGAKGEQSHRGGYDATIGALSGLCYEQAGEGNPPVSVQLADLSTGIAAASSVLLAVRAQEHQGKGQLVDVTMAGAMAYLLGTRFTSHAGKAQELHSDPEQRGPHPLSSLYRTADSWLFLSAVKPGQWQRLRGHLGLMGEAGRETLTAAFAKRTTAEWVSELRGLDVDVADPIREVKPFVSETPAFRESGQYCAVDHRRYGTLWQPGAQVRFSATPAVIRSGEPYLGESTREVLEGAGIPKSTVSELFAMGVVAEPTG